MRVFAGLGHDHFITSEEIDIIALEQMRAKEEPEERGPSHNGGKKALDGAIAATIPGPAGDTQHGDAPGHGQHGHGNAVELADRRHRHLRLEAEQEW